MILKQINKALVISSSAGYYPCSTERPEIFACHKTTLVMGTSGGGSHQGTAKEIQPTVNFYILNCYNAFFSHGKCFLH